MHVSLSLKTFDYHVVTLAIISIYSPFHQKYHPCACSCYNLEHTPVSKHHNKLYSVQCCFFLLLQKMCASIAQNNGLHYIFIHVQNMLDHIHTPHYPYLSISLLLLPQPSLKWVLLNSYILKKCTFFWVLFISLYMVISRFIYFLSNEIILFFFITELYLFFMLPCDNFFLHFNK